MRNGGFYDIIFGQDEPTVSDEDLEMNYYFREGDYEHTFEYGQTQVPEWREKEEYEVLIERVKSHKKPVASLVLDNYTDKEQVWDIISSSVRHAKRHTNEWGVDVVTFTDMPDKSLGDVAAARQWEDDWDEFSNKHKTVGSYVDSGFDISSKTNPVTFSESALLYGYPTME